MSTGEKKHRSRGAIALFVVTGIILILLGIIPIAAGTTILIINRSRDSEGFHVSNTYQMNTSTYAFAMAMSPMTGAVFMIVSCQVKGLFKREIYLTLQALDGTISHIKVPLASIAEAVENIRRTGHNVSACLILAIKYSQHILIDPCLAIIAEHDFLIFEIAG